MQLPADDRTSRDPCTADDVGKQQIGGQCLQKCHNTPKDNTGKQTAYCFENRAVKQQRKEKADAAGGKTQMIAVKWLVVENVNQTFLDLCIGH